MNEEEKMILATKIDDEFEKMKVEINSKHYITPEQLLSVLNSGLDYLRQNIKYDVINYLENIVKRESKVENVSGILHLNDNEMCIMEEAKKAECLIKMQTLSATISNNILNM